MGRDLTIRLIGRPKVVKDSQVGFQTMTRKYVVHGYRASYESLIDPTNPLFLDVGTEDEEFPSHYLANQTVEPTKSLDKAYLVRTFVKIRDTYHSETSSESGDLKRLARKYTVIRAEHSKGYDTASWGNHPQGKQVADNSDDPWDYLPTVVRNTEPVAVSYTDDGAAASALFSNASSTPSDLDTPKVSISGGDLTELSSIFSNATSADSLTLKWLRANVQVDMSNPGIDTWTVSWVAPVSDHWASGAKSTGSKSSKPPSMIEFDFNGMRIMRFGSNSSSGGPSTMHTYTSYVVGESPGSTITSYFGSSASVQPAVSMDFNIIPQAGSWGSASFKQHLANAFYIQNTNAYLYFPDWYGPESVPPISLDDDGSGNGIPVAKKIGATQSLEFKFNFHKLVDASQTGFLTGIPHYKYSPIIGAGGNISWSHTYLTGVSGYSQMVGSSVKPIFSHNNERVWKITLIFAS